MDSCEWNPEENRASLAGEHEVPVEVLVGANGLWRLCASCAALPKFGRYTVREEVKGRG